MYNKILIVKHIENEGAGTLETFFKGRGFVPVILELAKGESFPENIKEYKAVVIMGGPMNVYEEDKYYFLKEENIFIKEILREKIPFLGICFGAQLLAKALGAKIKKAPVKEIGWYEISLTKEGKEDPFFKNISHKFNVFQWHEDMFELPKKSTLLSVSDTEVSQAFKYGENAYGFQFHIEATPQMIEGWLKNELLSRERSKIILESYKNKVEYERRAQIIYTNFLKVL
ncbi:MAG: hypothetical protein A2452_00950 [Candidatus Firestonebacteria bacterium RIFOXYC2_FULL_39_67]|nr:MAG: hypothetical protein A2536_10910 [Candidatus Firestonebacteria bacterium RIFOXYD2_FULL_39_29]OGF54779.1 MAG: hypothetical protein A2452_00950 [Candidatus Firestonebacteria bacterium RIFOXYC2_FULL_39_67]